MSHALPTLGDSLSPRVVSDLPWNEADVDSALIGHVVKLLRERRGFTQHHVARLAALTQPTLSRIERGQRRVTLHDAGKLARALDLEDDALLQFIRDARARAEHATTSAIACGKSPWWEVALRVTGTEGLRGLLRFAAAAAVHPWRETLLT